MVTKKMKKKKKKKKKVEFHTEMKWMNKSPAICLHLMDKLRK